MDAAYALGAALARNDMVLVYGGGNVGLMGRVADGALAEGGEVIGIIPHFLEQKELMHPGVTDLRRVRDLPERKQKMIEESDGFVALWGGFGTLDELFEVITAKQLGQLKPATPIIAVNEGGFYDGFIQQIDTLVNRGYVKPEHRTLFTLVDNHLLVTEALLNSFTPAALPSLKRAYP